MRYEKIDILRWIAIFLMILFHFNYSLLNIFEIDLLNFSNNFWYYLWKISAFLFIFLFWFSFFLAENKYWKNIYKKYLNFSLLLWWISLFISFITFYFLKSQFIAFWILHFFALSSLLILLFKYFKYYNLLIWILIIFYWFFFIPIVDFKYLFFLWYIYPWFHSADFYPVFPYFWIVLIWYFSALLLNNFDKLSILKIESDNNYLNLFFQYLWKKSLIIYLIHQPIIIFLIYILVYKI